MTQELQILFDKTNIKDHKNFTKEEILLLTELQGKNEISKSQIKALVEVVPEFVNLQMEAVKSMVELIKSRKEIDVKAIDPILESIEGLSIPLEIMGLKATHSKVAFNVLEKSQKIAETYLQILEICDNKQPKNAIPSKKQPKDKNKLWTIIGTATTLIATGATFIYRNKKS